MHDDGEVKWTIPGFKIMVVVVVDYVGEVRETGNKKRENQPGANIWIWLFSISPLEIAYLCYFQSFTSPYFSSKASLVAGLVLALFVWDTTYCTYLWSIFRFWPSNLVVFDRCALHKQAQAGTFQTKSDFWKSFVILVGWVGEEGGEETYGTIFVTAIFGDDV